MHVSFISQRIISVAHMSFTSFTSSRLFAEVPYSHIFIYSRIDGEAFGGNFEDYVSNLILIEQSADQNNVCALAIVMVLILLFSLQI